LNHIHLPSVVGIGSTDLGLLSAGLTRRGSKPSKPHSLRWTDTTYLVGNSVERFTRPIKERLDFARLSEGTEARALTYTALGLLLGSGTHTVSIMVGLPVTVMADRELARNMQKALRGWLVGKHAFELNKQNIGLEIEGVRIMTQPGGAFFAWGFDDQSNWVRSRSDLQALIGICDIGFNTLDLLGVQGGEVLREYTQGDTAGVRRAAEILIQQVERYGVRLSHHEADTFLRGSRPVLSCAAGDIDLRSISAEAIGVAADQVLAFLNEHWEQSGRFRHLLFTGGGALLFRSHLERAYPQGLILSESVSANALGLARYGLRAFKDANTVVGLDPGYGGFKATVLHQLN
jgi:hypothetical protein